MSRPKRIVKNFRSRLDKLCSNDDLRPALNNVYFKNGFAFATNAHLLIKSHLSLHDFTKEEIEILEGKMIHRKSFEKIYLHDVVKAEEDGFHCFSDGREVIFKYDDSGSKYPNADSLILDATTRKPVEINEIGISLRLLGILKQGFIEPDLPKRFSFGNKNKSILLTNTDEDEKNRLEFAIVMPASLT